jgi:iron(III) transport system permease protein
MTTLAIALVRARARLQGPALGIRWSGLGLFWLAAIAVAAGVVVPLVYVGVRALEGGSAVWLRLWSSQIPLLLANTLTLVFVTTLGTIAAGVLLAWLVERCDLPGRATWRWLLALPLGVPPYVGALAYLVLLRPRSDLQILLARWLNTPPAELPWPDLFSLGGTALVLGLFTYPHVYLLVAAALRTANQTFEEAATLAGGGRWQAFWRVTLPLLRPSIGAGALLVALYVLADFGAVALLRYRTFTYAIYAQFTGQIDRSGAAALSVVLIVIAALLLAGEARAYQQARFHQVGASWRPPRPVALGRWRWPAFAFAALVVALALVLPLAVLAGLTWQGLADPTVVDRVWARGQENLWGYLGNTVVLAALAATLAVAVALPAAYLVVFQPGRASRALFMLGQVGYALPGVVVALSLVLLFNRWLPALYGTVPLLIVAYLVRFLPQAFQSNEAAFRSLQPALGDAARLLGRGPLRALGDVVLPLAAPGLAAGWALVWLTVLKELPATLLLRPPGFDTLAVRVWIAASDAVYTQAAPYALVLVASALLPLAILLTRSRLGIEHALGDL